MEPRLAILGRYKIRNRKIMNELEKSLKAAEEKEFWEPTMLLKYFKTGRKLVGGEFLGIMDYRDEIALRQQWISDRGNFEWRDIEIE